MQGENVGAAMMRKGGLGTESDDRRGDIDGAGGMVIAFGDDGFVA